MSETKDLTENNKDKPSNFLRQIIEHDLSAGTYAQQHFGGSPGDAKHHDAGDIDFAKIRTRFPPEPNGYLHIGHAKSLCLNFGLAQDYDGVCHLRFDDTNPEKEDVEYVNAIKEAVLWLGFDWNVRGGSYLYFASDYFDFMHQAALFLIEAGYAYVDEQSPDEMRINRGDFKTPGVNSPFRDRSIQDNLARFEDMRAGRLEEGAAVLRAKIDMTSPNINMRDPAIYRIKHAEHHNTGNKWCIYPMYAFAHPVEDAMEKITHSFCSLEFEDQRPFYDWVLERLCEFVTLPDGRTIGGMFEKPLPHQYEFARLNLTSVVTSKRKLRLLVNQNHVNGWDDPRMPTLVGLRRRGYTSTAIRLFCDRIGVSKATSWIDYSTLEIALRDDLESKAVRAMAVLDPVKLTLTNWGEEFGGDDFILHCKAPKLPSNESAGERNFTMTRQVWIERDDFEETPPKGYRRLFPGNSVRLKYGCIVECTGCVKDENGKVIEVLATVVHDTVSGTPGAAAVKVKGTITWVGTYDGEKAQVRLYDRLFTDDHPDAGGKEYLELLNPESLIEKIIYVEPGVTNVPAETHFQFERLGYFVTDQHDHNAVKPVFNRVTTLKDQWKK